MGGINKRGELIQKGQEVILSKGYDLASVKDIAAAATLPKGSFYHYFESKEKFALEAMNDFIATYEEKLPDEDFNLESLQSMIDARIDDVIKINFARECYMSIMCHAYTDQDEVFRESVVTALDKSNEAMILLLQKLKEKELIKAELDLTELLEFIDFAWRGARLKARLTKSPAPLRIFKAYLFQLISN